jgi:hypothetical protein
VRPIANVIGLVTAGKEDGVGGAKFFGDERRGPRRPREVMTSVVTLFARAGLVKFRVVFVRFGRAQYDDVASAAVRAENARGFLDVTVTAEQNRDVARRGNRSRIFRR